MIEQGELATGPTEGPEGMRARAHAPERRAVPAGAADIAADLARLGVTEGDALMVHAAMRAMDPVIGGARGLIEALIEAVGAPGLIVMPAYSRDALLPEPGSPLPPHELARLEAQVPGFDPALSSCHQLGALAETFRCWPGVVRSRHPVHSLTALGPGARALVAQHPRDWAFGLDGPMGRLADTGRARILLLGCGWERCSALHTAETIARHRRLRVLRVKDVSREPARWVHIRDVAEDREGLFPEIGQALDAHPDCRLGQVAGAEARLVPLDELLATAAPWIAATLAAGAAGGPDGTGGSEGSEALSDQRQGRRRKLMRAGGTRRRARR